MTVGEFRENAYLVLDEVAGAAVLVDPGAEPERIAVAVRESKAELQAIWLTHGHLDHIGGIAAIKRIWDVPVYLHPEDRPLYARGAAQAAVYGIPFEQPPAPERELAEGDRVRVGEIEFAVWHVPGHSPGHVVFVGRDVVIGGDLLFAGSIGRTDLPLSNPAHMTDSLARICGLNSAVIVHPGHGPSTTIGTERATNPFLTEGVMARP